jgi:hypothetical protein
MALVSHMNSLSLGGSVPIGPLIFWVTLLTGKHLIADFFLQTKWIADGKEARTGWEAPLLVHCAIHGALSTAIILVFEPRLWFLGLVDYAIHFIADRAKGYCTAKFGLKAPFDRGLIPSALENDRWVPLRLERRRLTPAGAFACDEWQAKADAKNAGEAF